MHLALMVLLFTCAVAPCSKAAKSVRHKLPHQAVNALVQMVARDKRMADDVSIIILDMLPPPAVGVMPAQFPASALQVSNSGGSGVARLQVFGLVGVVPVVTAPPQMGLVVWGVMVSGECCVCVTLLTVLPSSSGRHASKVS